MAVHANAFFSPARPFATRLVQAAAAAGPLLVGTIKHICETSFGIGTKENQVY